MTTPSPTAKEHDLHSPSIQPTHTPPLTFTPDRPAGTPNIQPPLPQQPPHHRAQLKPSSRHLSHHTGNRNNPTRRKDQEIIPTYIDTPAPKITLTKTTSRQPPIIAQPSARPAHNPPTNHGCISIFSAPKKMRRRQKKRPPAPHPAQRRFH